MHVGSMVTRRFLTRPDCSCAFACWRETYTCFAKLSSSGGSCTADLPAWGGAKQGPRGHRSDLAKPMPTPDR